MSNPGPFHLRWRGQVSGPFSQAEVLQKLGDHEIGLWHEIGQGDEWMTLGEYLEQQDRESAAKTAPTPPPQEPPSSAARATRVRVSPSPHPDAEPSGPPLSHETPPVAGPPAKSLFLFVALGALLGFTGAHNFYAGYRGTAIAQLVLAGVTLALGFGLIISWIWALIELVIVHTDARGIRMR